MPVVSMFFGIVIRMYYDDHNPPHLHAEYQGEKAVIDFRGNILKGNISSKTILRLIREWIDLHPAELSEDWELAKSGQEVKRIAPLE